MRPPPKVTWGRNWEMYAWLAEVLLGEEPHAPKDGALSIPAQPPPDDEDD